MLVTNEMLAVNEVSNIEGGDKLIGKCRKFLKTRKLSKFQKSAKLEKKLWKSENLPNFDAKKNGPSFLTPKARCVFNCLQLIFTKAPILWHFDLKYYIWIEIDALGYEINRVLS